MFKRSQHLLEPSEEALWKVYPGLSISLKYLEIGFTAPPLPISRETFSSRQSCVLPFSYVIPVLIPSLPASAPSASS